MVTDPVMAIDRVRDNVMAIVVKANRAQTIFVRKTNARKPCSE